MLSKTEVLVVVATLFIFMQVLSDALAAGAKLACISETLSQPSDEVCASILDQLPPELASHIRVYSSALHAGANDPENNSSSSSSGGMRDDEGVTGFSAQG
jgi:hypothetical protein